MCGRFVLTDTDTITSRFNITNSVNISEKITPHYNIAPTQNIPVIYKDENQDNRIEFRKWGLVPFWAKDPKIGHKMINARAETLTQKPSFKPLIKSKRCLVPSSGFYEWKRIDKRKVPYYIGIKDIKIQDSDSLMQMLKPYPDDQMIAYTVSYEVNNPKNDNPQLIRKVN